LVFLGGAYSHAILKAPKQGDFRVQEEHGGVIARAEPPPELRVAAERALEVATAGSDWLYARVDGVRRGGRLEVMEIELVEPSLYLRFDPASPARLARAIAEKRGKIAP
jgi:glutathione synthase/RimK-type ligase-like ATP-grasp enzyme